MSDTILATKFGRRRIPGCVHVADLGFFLVPICTGSPPGCLWCSPLSNDLALDSCHPPARERRVAAFSIVAHDRPCHERLVADHRTLDGLVRPVLLQIHHADEGQVPIVLIQVQAISKDKSIGDREAAVVDRDIRLPAFGLIQQACRPSDWPVAGFRAFPARMRSCDRCPRYPPPAAHACP